MADVPSGTMTVPQDPNRAAIDEVLEKIAKYHPGDDLALIEKAYQFARKAHEGQMRKSGEPYIIHPISVASTLADLMLDATTIAAGFLHDCVEDNESVTLETIESEFGAEVALLVDGVTKLSRLDFTSREEQQAESLRKMFLAMGKDIRVVLIKLADRLHNMRTLKYQKPERQVAIARETLDVYTPLAHRLGIFAIKWEMEDLALRYIDPEGYYQLVELVGSKRREREHTVQVVIEQLQKQLDEAGIKCEISGRPKHFYSIYHKMKSQHKTFDQIHDLFAVRVLVDTIPDCYATLGVVHTLWTQVPNRFKDYISMPKGNMYQSLHTTVVGTAGELRGQTFEVQIRTWEMHRTAEYGIAAHWRYKEGKQADTLDDKLYWLRQILDWQNDTRDPNEFMDALRVDLFSDEVFVFTSSASHGPSQDWLKLAKTSEAKSKIRAFFKRELHDENAEKGRDLLEHEAKRLGYTLSQLARNEYLEPVYRRYTMHSLDDICVTVGFGGLSSNQVINRLIEEYKKNNRAPEPPAEIRPVTPAVKEDKRSGAHHAQQGVVVEGDSGMLVRFAHCCNPLPGDDIVGYITRGRGVSVHRRDCTNMGDMMIEPERFVPVHWENSAGTGYEAGIRVIAYDRMGLLADISVMLAQLEVPIVAVSARADKSKQQRTTTIDLVLGIKDTQQLESIINRLLKRGDIIEVFRTNN